MLVHAIARALDLNDDGMVEQPIEQRGSDDGIAEQVAPFGEAAVGREDHRALFVSRVDQLEEQIAATRRDREVTDLVDHEQRRAAQEPDLLAQHAFALGLGEDGDQVGERDEVDAPAGPDGLDRKRGRQWLLPVPGGPSRWTTSAAARRSSARQAPTPWPCRAMAGTRSRNQ